MMTLKKLYQILHTKVEALKVSIFEEKEQGPVFSGWNLFQVLALGLTSFAKMIVENIIVLFGDPSRSFAVVTETTKDTSYSLDRHVIYRRKARAYTMGTLFSAVAVITIFTLVSSVIMPALYPANARTTTTTWTSTGDFNSNAVTTNTATTKTNVEVNAGGWTQVTDSAPWSVRYYSSAVVFNNKLWIMGGQSTSRKNDVWSSSDGITWTEETAAAGWSARIEHSSVVFNNKMWVMGGYDGSRRNDVWSSSDGITWTQETAAAGWSARQIFTATVFNNKMWVMGGYDGSLDKNDIWSSSDGITWAQETAAAEWAGREGHTSVVFNNKLWVIGGGVMGQRKTTSGHQAMALRGRKKPQVPDGAQDGVIPLLFLTTRCGCWGGLAGVLRAMFGLPPMVSLG
jgi:hypothetical protein